MKWENGEKCDRKKTDSILGQQFYHSFTLISF